jgi:excinuclease ABC subunit B
VLSPQDLVKRMNVLEKQMMMHAKNMEFEQAAVIRDEILALKAQSLIS